MKKPLLAATAALAATAMLTPATPAAAVDDISTVKLRRAVTVNGILQHERALQKIANDNGGTRVSGTKGYDRSVAYVARALTKAGYKVKTQSFTFPLFRELAPTTLSEVSPTARELETKVYDYSGSGDVTGSLVVAGGTVLPPTTEPSSTSGCASTDFTPAPSAPTIALVQRGGCNFGVKAANAKAAGYDAVIIFNEGQAGRTALEGGTLGDLVSIPVVAVDFATGNSLAAEVADGPVTVSVSTSTEYVPDATTTNVIADTPKGKTGTTVVVGAHLDSVYSGPGINDNGSGTSTILEIAEQLHALGYTKKGKLQRQVRFAFWGAEEEGLLGSEHYVSTLSDTQLEKIYADLNFDMLGSPNYARLVYDGDGSDADPDDPATVVPPPGSDQIEKIFTDYFAARGLASKSTAFDGRSDYGPFIDVGVPAGGLFSGAEEIKTADDVKLFGGTAGVAYDRCYHEACDTASNLNPRALDELGDAAAHATLVLARSKTGLFPDGSRVGARGKAGTARTRAAVPASTGPQARS